MFNLQTNNVIIISGLPRWLQVTLDKAALRVWLAAMSCLSRLERIGLIRTGSTREATGESNTCPVISRQFLKQKILVKIDFKVK